MIVMGFPNLRLSGNDVDIDVMTSSSWSSDMQRVPPPVHALAPVGEMKEPGNGSEHSITVLTLEKILR